MDPVVQWSIRVSPAFLNYGRYPSEESVSRSRDKDSEGAHITGSLGRLSEKAGRIERLSNKKRRKSTIHGKPTTIIRVAKTYGSKSEIS